MHTNAITETVRMESVREAIDSLCKTVLKDLHEKGLIK